VLAATSSLKRLVAELAVGLLPMHCTAIKVSESAKQKGVVEMSESLVGSTSTGSGKLLVRDSECCLHVG
jgi:hypothetical protein